MIAPTKPSPHRWRPNILIYGDSGTGKTKTWLDLVQLTGASALCIDTHHGTDAWVPTYPQGWDVVHSGSPDEIDQQVAHYCADPGDYTMFVVDDISVAYTEIQNQADDELRPQRRKRDQSLSQFTGVMDPGAWGQLKRVFAKPINKLVHLDMARVVVARSKPKYKTANVAGKMQMDRIGDTYSADQEMRYSFDLVLHLEVYGDHRVAVIEKARGMPDMPATIEGFTAAKLLALLPCGARGFTDISQPEPLIDADRAETLAVLFAQCQELGPTVWPAGRQSRALNAFGATSLDDVPLARFPALVEALKTVISGAIGGGVRESEKQAATQTETETVTNEG